MSDNAKHASVERATNEQAASESDHHMLPLSGLQRFMLTFKQNKLALFSACYLLALVFVAIFGQYILVHDPLEVDLSRVLEGPSSEHLLGTDQLGRSTLSRVVVATTVAFKAAALGVGIAVPGRSAWTIKWLFWRAWRSYRDANRRGGCCLTGFVGNNRYSCDSGT
jgi:hypothetical protein